MVCPSCARDLVTCQRQAVAQRIARDTALLLALSVVGVGAKHGLSWLRSYGCVREAAGFEGIDAGAEARLWVGIKRVCCRALLVGRPSRLCCNASVVFNVGPGLDVMGLCFF